MLDKPWYEVLALAPWTGFLMNSIGLLLSVWGIVAATGAKRAAQETTRRINNFNRSLEINSLSDKMPELKSLLSDINLNRDKIISSASLLREGCVKLQADRYFIEHPATLQQIEDCATFFGTIEFHVRGGVFILDSVAFNNRHDFLITLGQRMREVNTNGTA